jgi:glucose 1-dehydrogenase
MRLKGKTALVTGSAQGIGLGCALALAEDGADLILNDRPGSSELAAAVEQIRAMGSECVGIEADVFDDNGRVGLVKDALDQGTGGKIDILVSNPAFSRREAFLDYSLEDLRATLEGTLISGFHVSQLVAQHMVERGGGGKIVFISSVHAQLPFARSAPYGAAKAGLDHLARSVAVELIDHRINVNAIEPGWIDTPGERKAFDEETIQEEAKKMPWGRMGTPKDIGRTAAFLASDDADYITGSVIVVDGGFRWKDMRAQVLAPEKE